MVPTNLSKILFSTKNPPPWNDSPFCTLCKDSFTVTNRKHHCRKCGDTFCKNCSNKSMDLPEFGLTLPVRVCDSCYQHQYQRGGNSNPKKIIDKQKEIVDIINGSTCTTATSTKEDADLQLALKLSLQQLEPSVDSAKKLQEISRKEENMSVTIEKISDLEKDLIIQFANSMDTLSKEPPHQRYISDALYESYLNIYTYQGKLQIELEKISKKYQDVYSLKSRLLESLNKYETLLRAPSLPSTMNTNTFQAVYSNTTILNEPSTKTPQIQSSYYSVAEDLLTPHTTLNPQNLEMSQPNFTSKNQISQINVPPFSQQYSYTKSPQGIEYFQLRNLPQESFKFHNVNDATLQPNQLPSSQPNCIYPINSTTKFQPNIVPTYYPNPVPTYQVNPMPSAPELQVSKYDQPAEDEPLIEF